MENMEFEVKSLTKFEKILLVDELLKREDINKVLTTDFIKKLFNFDINSKANRFIRRYCAYRNLETPAISAKEVEAYRIATIEKHIQLYGIDKVFNIEYIKNLFNFEHRSARRWLQRYCKIKNIDEKKYIFDKNTDKFKLFDLIKQHISLYGEQKVLTIAYFQQLFNCTKSKARNRLNSFYKNNETTTTLNWRNNKLLLKQRLALIDEHVHLYGLQQVLKPPYLTKIFHLHYNSKYVYDIIELYCQQYNIQNPIRVRYTQQKINQILLDLLKTTPALEILNVDFIQNHFQYKNRSQVKTILNNFLNSNDYINYLQNKSTPVSTSPLTTNQITSSNINSTLEKNLISTNKLTIANNDVNNFSIEKNLKHNSF